MRFSISGHDKDTGQAIELIVEAVDVPSAAAVADRKGVRVTGVQPADGVTPPPMPVHGPRVAGLAPPSAMPRQTTPPKPKMRLWLGLFLVVSWLFAPVFPGYALGVGSTLALLVLLYLSVGPMRRGLGGFLRVSSDKPAWRAIKLTTFAIVSVSLIGFAAAGYAAQRASAELAVRKAVVDAARAQEEADANTQVSKLIDDAKAALTAGDITKAEQSINDALNVNPARNRGLAWSLQAAIKNAGDPAWALDTLARLSDADFEMFNSGSKTLASLDLGYSVLTDRAVANARTQLDAVVAKRAAIKKQEEDAAEARRMQAQEQRQQAIAAAEAANKSAEEQAAAEKARREAAQKEFNDKSDAYMSILNVASVRTIDGVRVSRDGKTWTAKLTVKNIWHLRHYQLRLQDAQTLWKVWAVIASPNDMDSARISLVDENDNEVGGSRFWGGSLIWVQEK